MLFINLNQHIGVRKKGAKPANGCGKGAESYPTNEKNIENKGVLEIYEIRYRRTAQCRQVYPV